MRLGDFSLTTTKKIYANASMQGRNVLDIEVRIPSNGIQLSNVPLGQSDGLHFHNWTNWPRLFFVFGHKSNCGFSKRKYLITATLVPCTPLTKELLQTICQIQFCDERENEMVQWYWDLVLGRKWYMIRCYSSDGKTLSSRQSDSPNIVMLTIRVRILTTQGHCKTSYQYRDISQYVPSSRF